MLKKNIAFFLSLVLLTSSIPVYAETNEFQTDITAEQSAVMSEIEELETENLVENETDDLMLAETEDIAEEEIVLETDEIFDESDQEIIVNGEDEEENRTDGLTSDYEVYSESDEDLSAL